MILQRVGGGSAEQQFQDMACCKCSIFLLVASDCAQTFRLQDWQNSTAVARAFRIGRYESQSVTQLLCHMNHTVKEDSADSQCAFL